MGEVGDVIVLDRQDAVEHLDHRHLRAHVVIEARELDADGTGADLVIEANHADRIEH